MATWWKPWNRMGRAVNLIYRWRRPRAISFRLAFFLLISTTIHLTAFYVFEVVYPPNKKLLPRDAAVWVLPENDPRIQALMARHGAALGGFRAVGMEASGWAIPFRLSFDNYVPRFEDLPRRELGRPLVYPDAVPAVLPPVENEMGAVAMPVVQAEPASASMVWRTAAGEESSDAWTGDWPTLPGDGQAGAEWEFQIAYDRHGRVIEVAISKGTAAGADALLRRQLLGRVVPENLPRPKHATPAWATVILTFPFVRHD